MTKHAASITENTEIRARDQGVAAMPNALRIDIGHIISDEAQPREEFSELELNTLAASIREKGILNPLTVRWDAGQAKYAIVAGERRWRAAKIAGMTTVPVTLLDDPVDESDRLELALVENCLREDLKPMEKAKAFRRLQEQHGWTAKQVAERLGLDPSTVTSTVRLLDLSTPSQARVDAGQLTQKAALAEIRQTKPKRAKRHKKRPAVTEHAIKVAAGQVVVSLTEGADVAGALEEALAVVRG
jgi:ParB family chromosome partitioning protein